MPNTISPEIALLELRDIPRLIDCVRRCYGDSYPNPLMYDATQLQEVIENKLMHSVIARLDNGEIVGHCALSFDDSQNTSPEAGKMLVDPEYRGHHIAENMAKKRIDIAKELGLPGFWTECVTNHPYSQHEMISFDAKETGLLIGDIPSTLSMQGLDNFSDTRMSLLTFYLPLLDSPHAIFLPKQHAEHVKSLAQELNLERAITSSDIKGSGETIINVAVNSSIQTANMSISHIGDDLITSVAAELQQFESLNLASVYLDLPIKQAAAANAYLELESLGFFWGSWIPNYSVQGDTLRLQKIYQKVNVAEIICAREQGEKVKRFVVLEWARVSKQK